MAEFWTVMAASQLSAKTFAIIRKTIDIAMDIPRVQIAVEMELFCVFIGYRVLNSFPNRRPKKLWPEPIPTSTILPQRGHLTGSEKTVAFFSMSGAVNLCPQCGQEAFTNPLNIMLML